MKQNKAALELVDRITSDLEHLRNLLTGDVETGLRDVVTETIGALPYPYRAWGLNDAVRRRLPGTTTKQIHATMRAMGYYQARDPLGIIWIMAG